MSDFVELSERMVNILLLMFDLISKPELDWARNLLVLVIICGASLNLIGIGSNLHCPSN
jgi:hypothetical protein